MERTIPFTIEEWDDTHPRWSRLLQLAEAQGQLNWVAFQADFHKSSHMLVAREGDELLGLLRFVTQEIGPDMDCPPLIFDGEALVEAKVLAFAVSEDHRRQGVGRTLQEHLVQRGRELGCYQVRSHSGGKHGENHHLKLSMGFGVHPVVRGDDRKGVYFIMPLRGRRDM